MKLIALEKAREHLEIARIAAAELKIDSGFKQYEQVWSQFLSQISRIYSKLEQGCKGCRKSEPWFGAKKHERRKDPLLAYVHHARDSDEHALEMITERTADAAQIPFKAKKGERVTASVLARLRDDGTVEFKDAQVQTSTGAHFKDALFLNPGVRLVRVTDSRFHDSFDPPKTHLGQDINVDEPPTVARLALAYLENMLAEAANLPIRQ